MPPTTLYLLSAQSRYLAILQGPFRNLRDICCQYITVHYINAFRPFSPSALIIYRLHDALRQCFQCSYKLNGYNGHIRHCNTRDTRVTLPHVREVCHQISPIGINRPYTSHVKECCRRAASAELRSIPNVVQIQICNTITITNNALFRLTIQAHFSPLPSVTPQPRRHF